ncbi:MAG: hypothetical protein MJ158_02335 [Alphaproteobacteria bacterium]|nr:hypothetical protein [Alphaproteobacteria bacterium]
MYEILYITLLIITTVCCIVLISMLNIQNKKIRDLIKNTTLQYNMIIKLQNNLKNKFSVNETTEKVEIIYQDLLQDLVTIMAGIEVMPRQTSEHPLWRAIGGIMEAYATNPFVLEKLRRAIKLDSTIARSVNHYLQRANSFLQYLSNTDSDGILASTFTDGLLGQSLSFFAQAQALANTPIQNDNSK